jgi:clan AA aspartic protease (TIGR02281 family)
MISIRSYFSLWLGVFLFGFTVAANADILYLKNGRSIEGIIKSEDSQNIELEVSGGTVKFDKNQIERIVKTSHRELESLRQKWETQKRGVEEKITSQRMEEESKPREVKFSKESRGIVLSVTLNKKVEATLILDTGASLIMLRRDIAGELGINLDRVTPDMKVQLADGRQVNAKHIVLDNVKVENVEAKNVEAAILLEETGSLGFDGLLGMSFLNRFNFRIDQKEKKLILEKF